MKTSQKPKTDRKPVMSSRQQNKKEDIILFRGVLTPTTIIKG